MKSTKYHLDGYEEQEDKHTKQPSEPAVTLFFPQYTYFDD